VSAPGDLIDQGANNSAVEHARVTLKVLRSHVEGLHDAWLKLVHVEV
jgi:hypothetical protein